MFKVFGEPCLAWYKSLSGRGGWLDFWRFLGGFSWRKSKSTHGTGAPKLTTYYLHEIKWQKFFLLSPLAIMRNLCYFIMRTDIMKIYAVDSINERCTFFRLRDLPTLNFRSSSSKHIRLGLGLQLSSLTRKLNWKIPNLIRHGATSMSKNESP